MECLRDLPVQAVWYCVQCILSQRLGVPWKLLDDLKATDDWQLRFPRITRRCGEAVINILSDAVVRHIVEQRESPFEDWIKHCVRCVAGVLDIFDWGVDGAKLDNKVLTFLPTLLSDKRSGTDLKLQAFSLVRSRQSLCTRALVPGTSSNLF